VPLPEAVDGADVAPVAGQRVGGRVAAGHEAREERVTQILKIGLLLALVVGLGTGVVRQVVEGAEQGLA